MMKRASFVLLVALLGAATGCGNTTCEDVCNERQDQCAPEQVDPGCVQSCRAVDTFNELAECEGPYSDLAECRIDDICGDPACEEEEAAWRACRDAFCATDSTNPLCNTGE